MKTVAVVSLIATMMCSIALAQDLKVESKTGAAKVEKKPANMWHGYIVDAMCAKGMAKNSETAMKKAMNHTRDCALHEECASSGFGIFMDGKYVKFDASGDKMAKEMLVKSKTEKNIMVEVQGEMKGDVLAVASISEHQMDKSMDTKKMMKSEPKKND